MDSSNLAIVMAPSIMPLPAAASAQRLEHHVALVKVKPQLIYFKHQVLVAQLCNLNVFIVKFSIFLILDAIT